jgi:hypothetical protein
MKDTAKISLSINLAERLSERFGVARTTKDLSSMLRGSLASVPKELAALSGEELLEIGSELVMVKSRGIVSEDRRSDFRILEAVIASQFSSRDQRVVWVVTSAVEFDATAMQEFAESRGLKKAIVLWTKERSPKSLSVGSLEIEEIDSSVIVDLVRALVYNAFTQEYFCAITSYPHARESIGQVLADFGYEHSIIMNLALSVCGKA